MGPIIDERKCSTVDEFLDAVSPFHSASAWPGGSEQWWFRGQSMTWPLTPTAMRKGKLRYQGEGCKPGVMRPKSTRAQVRDERGLVMAFGGACIRYGHPLPEDSQWLRSEDLQRHAIGKRWARRYAAGIEFPAPLHRSVYALAQHHGVPTRLLDWTLDPIIAAYFACARAARDVSVNAKNRGSAEGRLVVWGLLYRAFQDLQDFALYEEAHGRVFDPVAVPVEAPYADNPRLAAQKGIFSLVVHRHRPTRRKLPALDALLRDYGNRRWGDLGDEREEWPLARMVTLPRSEACKLLRRLGQSCVSAATVWPDYDGVVQGQRERRYWK